MTDYVEFYIVRHGETLLNKLGKTQGLVDSPLTTDGIESANMLKQSLQHIAFSTAYSSDLLRAYNTAQIICSNDVNVHKDIRLREWCLGNFEAVTSNEFINQIINCNEHLKPAELNLHLPEVCGIIKSMDITGMVETFNDITARLQNFFNNIGQQELNKGGGKILVVTHAFVIKTLLHMFAYEELKKIEKVSNSGATIICYDGCNFCVKAVNKLLF